MKLSLAREILDGAMAAGREKGAKPLAVVVLDAGGNPVIAAREDGCSLFRHTIAQAKAMGALGMGADTRVLAERAKGNPVFFQSVSAAVGGQVAFSPGGVLVKDAEGTLLGAVGISGDTGDTDEDCARAGIAAAERGNGAAQ